MHIPTDYDPYDPDMEPQFTASVVRGIIIGVVLSIPLVWVPLGLLVWWLIKGE